MRWLATTSRRSGRFIADALAAMAQTGEGGLETFIDFRTAGAGTLPIRANMATNARWQFVLLYTAPHEAKVRAVEDITAALLDGKARVGDDAGLPLTHFTLDDAAAAHQAVEDSTIGKVLIEQSTHRFDL